MLTTRRPIHARLCNFVDWIRTEGSREDAIRDQANEIRSRVKSAASKDGLTVRSTPWSGSFAKRTGLRRHLRGATPVEGQDVDLPFVISPKTKNDEKLESLLPRFYGYLETSYPDTHKEPTKSSVKLVFEGTKLSYDVVPMLATDDTERQILIRSNGDRRETSVQKHIEFVRSRTQDSNEQQGRVAFNEMVRLLKWWREVQCRGENSAYPTILIDLLCAYAYDKAGVDNTYPGALARWFGLLAHEVEQRTPIYFSDFTVWEASPNAERWAVIDPINADNNIAEYLGNAEIDVLVEWLAQARDAILQAIVADGEDDEAAALEALAPIFGNHIIYHS
jgi:hypothetical protein